MTEQEWLECTDPQTMLEFLRGKVSDRKLRLFACACCRKVWDFLDEQSRQLVQLAEQYVDGLVSFSVLESTSGAYCADEDPAKDAAAGPSYHVESSSRAARVASYIAGHRWQQVTQEERPAFLERIAVEQAEQCKLLRDIIGPVSHHPITAAPRWLSSSARAIAQTIYDDRAFDRMMPILGDALEEAGCDNTDVLAHCRGPGPHVRGCWCLDLVLEKE